MLYSVRLTVPRRGGLRAWGAVEGDFERGLAGQQDQAVTGLRVDRELRRGPDSVRVVIVAMTEASDVAEALGLTWLAVLEAMGEDLAGWDLARAEADVQPAFPLAVPVPPASAEAVRVWRTGSDTGHACGALVLDGASPQPSQAGLVILSEAPHMAAAVAIARGHGGAAGPPGPSASSRSMQARRGMGCRAPEPGSRR